MATIDDNNALLQEILGLLKANQEELHATKKLTQRQMILKGIWSTLVVIFVGAATYYYYHTLVTSLPS
jgi:hypothetical protein